MCKAGGEAVGVGLLRLFACLLILLTIAVRRDMQVFGHSLEQTEVSADTNAIRSRAKVAPVEATTTAEVLTLVEDERRKELFIEGQAHRWFDLKRTSRADAVYSKLDYKKWESHKILLPIPETQILRNLALTQNPGYDKK